MSRLMNQNFRRSRRGQPARQGSVLIIVLWVSLGLVAVALTFGHSMLMAYRGADNNVAGEQADQAIDGAVRYAETVLTTSYAAVPGLFPNVTTYQSEAVPVGDATFWFLGRDNNNTPTATPVFGLVDEASKLNLNSVDATTLGWLLQYLQISADDATTISNSIVNWRSQTGNGNGADTDTYQGLQPGYVCKHAKFESIEELGLVYGMYSTVLYGEDVNLNGVVDPNEDDGEKNPPSDNSNGTLDPGLLEYVTVFSKEPGAAAATTPTTPAPASNGTPMVSISPLTIGGWTQLRAMSSALSAAPLPQPPTFGSLLEFYVYLHALGVTDTDFALISASVTPPPAGSGLVNINTASIPVLTAVCAGNSDLAQQIASNRLGQAVTDTSINWVAQYFTQLSRQQYGAICKLITGKSYQVTADVAAVGRNGKGYRRARFVIDMSSGTPQIVYRRDLSHLGWAVGKDARQTLLSAKAGTL